MKIKLIPIYYSCDGCFRRLSIKSWCGGKYPLTYTVLECAEVYCELVGWKLLNLYKIYGDAETYSIRVEMPDDENVNRTILDNYYAAADLGPCRPF